MSKTLRFLQLLIAVTGATALMAGCATTNSPASPTPPIPGERDTATINPPIERTTTASLPKDGYMARESVQAFANSVALTRDIPLPVVITLLASAERLPIAIRLMAPPEPGQARAVRDWDRYRSNFVEPIRIRQGKAFLQAHAQALAEAENRYGVPANIITAIIGVETLYGDHMGNYRVLDAITTLSFDYPDPNRTDRITMFQGQLKDLIELHAQGKLDATRQLGSYAGAMGIPQFMPTSLKRYAVSASGTGPIDLEYNVNDAIFSVGRFLKAHGWIDGLPVFAPVTLPPDPQNLVDGGLTPTLDWAELQAAGASLNSGSQAGVWADYALGVIDLPRPDPATTQYRTATPNFFALTQYNRSYFYATAVSDLAEAIKP